MLDDDYITLFTVYMENSHFKGRVMHLPCFQIAEFFCDNLPQINTQTVWKEKRINFRLFCLPIQSISQGKKMNKSSCKQQQNLQNVNERFDNLPMLKRTLFRSSASIFKTRFTTLHVMCSSFKKRKAKKKLFANKRKTNGEKCVRTNNSLSQVWVRRSRKYLNVRHPWTQGGLYVFLRLQVDVERND